MAYAPQHVQKWCGARTGEEVFGAEVDVLPSGLPVAAVMVDPVEGPHPPTPPLWLPLLVGEDAEGKFFVGHHVVVGAAHRGTVLGHLGGAVGTRHTDRTRRL